MKKIVVPVSNDFCPQTLFLYGTYKEDGTPNFGLFCWFSYYWDTELGIMACIGGEKLTKDRIKANGIFSANLVTESMLPLADYLGNHDGYDSNKMKLAINVSRGETLNVPVLDCSPWSYELEVAKSLPMDDGEVFLCKIRNIQADEALTESSVSLEDRIAAIAPVRTTCGTYFGWDGRKLGEWGELQNQSN
jgi:flavin reductase (DIM6/NTAB) family NADH-FMN oxidoreductase RutF